MSTTKLRPETARERLILALDVPAESTALQMVHRLRDRIGTFKIGLQLFTANGPSIVHQIVGAGSRVFLDLKLHDIPNTVGNAVLEACRLGVDMLTLHISGGYSMLARAREVKEAFHAQNGRSPLLLGVTVLTSLNQSGIERVGFQGAISELVMRLARVANDVSLDGIVCSPQELTRLRQLDLDLLFVTPGIRPRGSAQDDQSRTMTARMAVRSGADFVVVGRPILAAPDPEVAAQNILSELEADMM